MTGKDNARLTKVGRHFSTTLEDVYNKWEREGDENGQLDCVVRNGRLSCADRIAMWSNVWTNRALHACGKWQEMLTVCQTTDGYLLIHYSYWFSFVAVCLGENSGISCPQHCVYVCACVVVCHVICCTDRFCSARLDILPQKVAAKSSIFCRAWHKNLGILLHFAPEKRVFYPIPVQ